MSSRSPDDFRVPGVALFWTPRRRRLWRSCRRRYFLHYYAAPAGIDPDAPAECRLALSLRNAMPMPVFIQRLLNIVMREEFYREPDEDGGYSRRSEFVTAACRRGEAEWRRLAEMTPVTGDSRPLLLELFNSVNSMTVVGLQLRDGIRSEAGRLASGVWTRLDAVDSCRRRPISSPLAVQLNELRCFAVPALALAAPGGEFWIIEGVRSGREGADEIALMHKFHALNTLGKAPEKIRSFALAPGNFNFMELAPHLDVSAAIRGIREDIIEMTGVLNPDGSAAANAFPAAPGETCSACPFRSVLCRER